MSRIGNGLTGCKVAVLAALVTVLPGCGSLQIKSAEVSGSLNIGVLQVSGKFQYEKKPSDKSMPIGMGSYDIASAAADSRFELSASNAQIPDQTTLATVIVKDSNGGTVAAKTFAAKVVTGRGTFTDPTQVENWFNSISIPDNGAISIAAPDLEIRPPQSGSYTATSKMVISSQVVASATVSGYIAPGGGDNPPTHPK